MNPNPITKFLQAGLPLVLLAGLLAAPGSVLAHGDEKHEGEAKATAKEEAAPSAETGQPQHQMTGSQRMSSPGMPNMRMPSMNPERGRKLFVSKGCVACHAINGVGGHDATALDAHTMQPMMNPFEFAAKMWAMAPAMIYAQEEALGAQILFTGDELADIVAFVHNDEAQHSFGEGDLTARARKMMNHEHGKPGGGAHAHGEELGHEHGADDGHAHGKGGSQSHMGQPAASS
ncbi:MAG: c-type cytochrome, partial [Kiloniellales bacterium]